MREKVFKFFNNFKIEEIVILIYRYNVCKENLGQMP